MNTDLSDALFTLDSSFFYPFDGSTMSMSLDAADSLQPSFETAPGQPSSTALAESAEQSPFSPPDDTTGTNPPREPLGPGTQNNQSMLTEFTKRRNWSARVVEELQDLLHILDSNGRIKHVSPSAENLTGYKPAELHDLLMRDLLHPDDVGVFTAELNESIASGAPLRVFYRMRKKDGDYTVFEAVGHAHIAAAKFAPNPNNQSPFCQAVFVMARPYPTKNAALLDSFLEHKMENERLKRKIAELQKEEQDDAEESERTWQQSPETTPSESGMRFNTTPFQPSAPADISVPPGGERRMSLDSGPPAESVAAAAGSSSGTRPASIGTVAAATSTSTSTTHADTIEMLTGLRYTEGERSRGITTGNPSPALVTGDAGIAIPQDRGDHHQRGGGAGDKKKKIRMAEEYVCTDCGQYFILFIFGPPLWVRG
jgi:PAS domain S-box-containing protein